MNIILTLFCLPLTTYAATTISWEELTELATKNLSLQSSVKSFEASKANLKQSYSGFLPQVSLGASQSHSKTTPENTVSTNQKTNSISASASLNVFNGFSTIASIKSAKASMNESEYDSKLKSADVRYDLRVAFFNLYIQQERIRLYEKVLKRREQNEKLVSIKYNAGTEAKWNVQLNKAELEKAQFNLNAAKDDLEQAKNELARVLNLDALPSNRAVQTPNESIYQNINSDAELMISKHPKYLKYDSSVNKYDADRITARAGFLPSIDLSYSRSESKVEQNPKINERAWSITATWNIFNGLSDFYKIQKANAYLEAAELEKENAVRSLETDLKLKNSNLKNARARLPIIKGLREATEARLQTVSAQYRSGLKTYLDWEQAENQLVDAEQSEINAKKDALFALADLEKTLGKGLNEK